MGGSALGQCAGCSAALRADAAAHASRARAVELGTAVELTLRDAIERALKRQSRDSASSATASISATLRIWGARGAYDPLAGFSIGNVLLVHAHHLPAPGRRPRVRESCVAQVRADASRSCCPRGGSLNASFSSARASTNNAFSFVDPLFSSGLTIGFEQPLLRGLFSNPVRQAADRS